MSILPTPGRAESIPEPPSRIESAVGAGIAQSLGLGEGAALVAIDGGPARPLDRSRTWTTPGRRLVMVSSGGGEPRWFDVRVGEPGPAPESVMGRYRLDRTPPSGSLKVEGASITVSDRLWLGKDARLSAEVSDVSGVVESRLLLDGQPVVGRSSEWPPGEHRLAVEATDRAGNRGEAVVARVAIDDRGPEITWRMEEPGVPGASGQPVHRVPVTVIVEARDAGVGLERLWRPANEETLQPGQSIEVDGEELRLAASDRLGNRTEVTARWLVDRDPPVLRVLLDGVEQPAGEVVRVPAGGAVEMRAEDAGLGVASAVYRVNGAEWKPLSDSLRFVDRGWYQVEIRAEDIQGLVAQAFWDIRTGNPRALRPQPKELIDDNQ